MSALRYAITTFGCQMNVHDSERMHEVLRGAGYVEVDEGALPDVVLLNTCSVRERAEQKLKSELGRLAIQRRERPGMLVVVAGCVAQQEGERLLRSQRGVDLVVGPDNIPELPRLLSELAGGAPPLARTVFDLDAPHFLTAATDLPRDAGSAGLPDFRASQRSATAFVTTMKGCDERCSFCIVPYTRGPERYRPYEEITAEISALVDRGVAEVTLLGQTVNSYRDPTGKLGRAPLADPTDPDESEFAALLRGIAERVPGLQRLRYTSPHPRHLVPSLVRAHAELDVLSQHVHLPVQSGSDRLLKRMIRRYTRAEYVTRVNLLRSEVPGLTLSTDIIVGFPGETEADFDDTLSLIEEIGFVGVFGFKYSPRPYTPALKLGDDVSEATKSERLTRLFEISERLLRERLVSLIGTEQLVLLEGPSKRAVTEGGPAPRGAGDPGAPSYTGRTSRNEIVHVAHAAAEGLVGEIARVRVARALKHSIVGELMAESATRGAERLLARGSRPPARKRALPILVEGA